jgi:hypothetical protein
MNNRPSLLIHIARILNLTPGALSNWQKRYDDFPQPVASEGKRRLYLLSEIKEFMSRHDLKAGELSAGGHGARKLDVIEEQLIRSVMTALRSMTPVGPGSLLAAAVLAVVAKEKPDGLANAEALGKVVAQLESADGDFRVGLQVLRALPAGALDSLLGNWSTVAAQVDHVRIADSLRSYVRETSTRNLGAEHTSSPSIAALLRGITSGLDILDMCSGFGMALREYSSSTNRRVGQEINAEVAALSRLLARLDGYSVEILNEDALAVCHEEWISSGFHAVLVDAPIAMRQRDDQISPTDLRWTHHAVSRASLADDYWIQSALAYLRQSDEANAFRAAVVLRPGWFFDGAGGPFRDALLKSGVVEAVISLGSGIIPQTAIPVSVLVLRKFARVNTRVKMIDAQEAGRVIRGLRTLSEAEIKAIAAALDGHSGNQVIDTVKVLDVSVQEILQNGSVLDVRRYIVDTQAPVSINTALNDLDGAMAGLAKAMAALTRSLSELRPREILDLQTVPKTGFTSVPLAGGKHNESMVRSAFKSRRQGEEWTPDDVRPDDVVVCTMGVQAGDAVSGQELLERRLNWSKIWIIRTNDPRVRQDYLLAWARYGSLDRQVKRLITGTTVPTIAMRDIPRVTLPVPSRESQIQIAQWGHLLDTLTQETTNVSLVHADLIHAAKAVSATYFIELDHYETRPQ